VTIAGPLPKPTGFGAGHKAKMAAIPASERPSCHISGEPANGAEAHHHTPHGFIFAQHYAKYKEQTAEGCEKCGKPMTGGFVVSKRTGKKFCGGACANAWAQGQGSNGTAVHVNINGIK
jgi:hypothetical protein